MSRALLRVLQVYDLDAIGVAEAAAAMQFMDERRPRLIIRHHMLPFQDGLSMLEIARMHHAVLLDVLDDSRHEDLRDIASAAAEFLVEVLATYDMTHRSLPPRTAEPG